jgi:mitochondrial chaperone BCS1
VVSLAKKGLDDSSLNELICSLPSRSIALMEDIDAAFHHAAIARDGVSGSTAETTPTGGPSPPGSKDLETKGVTLSGLLGALDGVAAQEGRILFATTNRYEALDEALCRAGRMDVHVEFKMATRWQARELFRCFFPPLEADEEAVVSLRSNVNKEKGLATPSSPAHTQAEAEALAEQFADAVPEGQFSMASLQGLLMRHKERPRDALAAVAAWVGQESRKRGATVKEVKEVQEKEVQEKEVQEKGVVKAVKDES